ncbi:hypothetical protein QJS10_CPA06g00654 [Acorus calamus]|uniref:Uncharacterized protein n=1 Tax=Acorus calamus TaxID=4465 RepID=A0AAV9EKW4_ACOCL|nr:hypothetical protein QJS10_CPB18g01197 [Acorus calamus]KAK1313664.1 hypothetical protein QJS10_CPA06g00654 [Acorus calamus]
MKRASPWNQSLAVSSDEDSSSSDSEDDSTKPKNKRGTSQSDKDIISGANLGKKKSLNIDYDTLSRHGYGGGLSILKVPPPKEAMDNKEPDWKWSDGKESTRNHGEAKETFEERERTRAAIAQGEKLTNAQTSKEKKGQLSYSQKEKRKRDLGQVSRGKNYVEEEKRLLRDSGVYSGFDC